MAYIYRHIRLDKNVPFYIGYGSGNSYRRASDNSKHRRSEFWGRVANKTDISVEIVLDGLSREEAIAKEKELIALYGRINIGTGTLVNLTDGGDGGAGQVFSKERREMISKIIKARPPVSEITRQKMSEGKRGTLHSLETREKMSRSAIGKQKCLGHKHTEQHRLNRSRAVTAWWANRKNKDNEAMSLQFNTQIQ